MSFDELSPDFQEKAKACKSAEELNALCAEVGVKLSDEEIENLAGGQVGFIPSCTTKCGTMRPSTCPDAKR